MKLRRRTLSAAMAWAITACSQIPVITEPPPAPVAAANKAVPAQAAAADVSKLPPMIPMQEQERTVGMNEVASAYVKLVLALGQLDPDYVDSYYGPPAWRDEVKRHPRRIPQILDNAQELISELSTAAAEPADADPDLLALRKSFLKNQLGSLSARARMLGGEKFSFDDEARALYDIDPPHYREADFEPVLKRLDELLPKESGTLAQRYNRYIDRFAVPRAKLDTVMRIAIDAVRARTLAHLPLPNGEHFELSLVSGKPWTAYNWFQGHYLSRIEVNTDLPITVSRVIELAAHEGYPGHHVYNSLLENHLVDLLKWPEYQVYALYSPQSFIAEGSADFGVGLVFPGDSKLELTRQLFAAAGFDGRQAATYVSVVEAARKLEPASIEAARRYLDGAADTEKTLAWLETYTLASPARAGQRLAFIQHYRSYIVNYTYGEEVVRGFIENYGSSLSGSESQWQAFLELSTTPRTPTAMQRADAEGEPRPDAAAPLPSLLVLPPLPESADAASTPADPVEFQQFIASKPTPAHFRQQYPQLVLILPGAMASKELRTDGSRYFAELDHKGRIIGGSFK